MIKKLTKILLLGSAIFSSIATAADPEGLAAPITVVSDLKMKLSAYGHFQAGYRNQNHLTGDDKKVSANRANFAFYNEAALMAEISNTVEGMTYGGKIVLVPTAKRKGNPTYNGSHIFLESDLGRVEAGSPMSVASNMYIDSGEILAATGGDWDRYAKLTSNYLKQDTKLDPSFGSSAEFFLDYKLLSDIEGRRYSNEPGRRISYYTPKFDFNNGSKVQVGVSFTPDSSNTGADTPDKNSVLPQRYDINDTQYFKIDKSVKNAVSGGIKLEHNISDGVDVKLALTGELGKAATAKLYDTTDKTKSDALLETHKLKDLRTFNIGAILNVGNLSYAASYGSLGKSLTTPAFHRTGKETHYYTGGVTYKQGPFSASVGYFRSDQYKNTVDCVTLGTDYKLAAGLKPYAEISAFSLKGKPEYRTDLQKRKTRGTVALIGTKLSL